MYMIRIFYYGHVAVCRFVSLIYASYNITRKRRHKVFLISLMCMSRNALFDNNNNFHIRTNVVCERLHPSNLPTPTPLPPLPRTTLARMKVWCALYE